MTSDPGWSDLLLLPYLLCVTVLPTRGIDVFDTLDVPDRAEVVPIKISNIRRSDEARQDKLGLNPMPTQLDVNMMCHGERIQFNLHHHESERSFDNADDVINNQTEVKGNEDLPVLTQEDNSAELLLDNFPRLYSRTCRTFRDPAHQAAFLVMRDPADDSYKFMGTFVMGRNQFFVQPFAGTSNSTRERLHVSSPLPDIDFSYDDGSTFVRVKEGDDNMSGTPRPPGSYEAENFREMHNSVLADINKSEKGENRSDSSNKQTNSRSTSWNGEGLNSNQSTKRDDKPSETPTRSATERHQAKSRFLQRLQKNLLSKKTLRRAKSRWKRASVETYNVEIVLVCDFQCYKYFEEVYETKSAVQTKNVIIMFFSYVQEYLQVSYGSIFQLYPSVGIEVKPQVQAVYIASSSRVKIIGTYTLGGEDELAVDARASLYEFAIWVQDNIAIRLRADHYALVTGYDLYGARFIRGVVGLISRIPSICEIDSVSLNEATFGFIAPVVSHELGHSLGAQHDGLTNGVCRDFDQFIMSAFIAGTILLENAGNAYRFSVCSAIFFRETLPEKSCVRRQDFQGTPFRPKNARAGQDFSLDEQCSLRRGDNSTICRDIVVNRPASWDRVCSALFCSGVRSNRRVCFIDVSLEFSSCGNKRWCRRGFCVDSPQAPKRPVDCPTGDSPAATCNRKDCTSYSAFTRFVQCCQTCKPLKTERFVIL